MNIQTLLFSLTAIFALRLNDGLYRKNSVLGKLCLELVVVNYCIAPWLTKIRSNCETYQNPVGIMGFGFTVFTVVKYEWIFVNLMKGIICRRVVPKMYLI